MRRGHHQAHRYQAVPYRGPEVPARRARRPTRRGHDRSPGSRPVGAVVSATASDGVHVRHVASRGTPPPMVLVGSDLEPMPQSRPIKLAAGSNGDMTVTLFY